MEELESGVLEVEVRVLEQRIRLLLRLLLVLLLLRRRRLAAAAAGGAEARRLPVHVGGQGGADGETVERESREIGRAHV